MKLKVIFGVIYFAIVLYIVLNIFSANLVPSLILDFDKWILSAGALIIFYEGWKYFKKPAAGTPGTA